MAKMNNYQSFIHCSRYARWLPKEGRRETWEETVDRYRKQFDIKCPNDPNDKYLREYINAIKAVINLEVMPSMRCLMTAGKALERDNVAGYNCSYTAVDHPRVFDEIMYILMCGTGVGFSVERQYVSRLPTIPDVLRERGEVLVVRDSKIGWCEAFRQLIRGLYQGDIHGWDTSFLRCAGAPLKTFGGRSSGPEPLESLFRFTINLFKNAQGRRLTSIECHDLVCKVADVIVSGGVRRSALISLSNLSDDRMRTAKSGAWYDEDPQRALANNSAVYTDKPAFDIFLKEWVSLYESKSGERGLFSRAACQNQAARNGRREHNKDFGTNPCSEIILRSGQFCNLTEVVVRADDTLQSLKRKVRQATILGTLQSTLTNFRYLRKHWAKNTAEERLLGVSLTGIMDHPILSGACRADLTKFFGHDNWSGHNHLQDALKELKDVAIETNKEWAAKLGIPQSTAITCVKPSGTVSQLVDSSSGIHSRYAPFYVRRVTCDNTDPLTKLMIDQGVPHEGAVNNPNATIFSFPHKAPENAKCVKDDTAIGQLNLWKIYQESWCEHKPSISVYYKDAEFLDAGRWVYDNFNDISGVSFFPRSDHIYQQAPYSEITEEEYDKRLREFPQVEWSKLSDYEKEDRTVGSQELACSAAGGCEI